MTIVKPSGSKDMNMYVDNYKTSRYPHALEQESWRGVTAFKFEVPLEIDADEDAYEVNETTLATICSQEQEVEEGKKTELEKLLKYQAVEVVLPQRSRSSAT